MKTIREYETATGISVNSSANQRLIDNFVSQHIIYNVSIMMTTLIDDMHNMSNEWISDIDAAFETIDYESAAEDWIDDLSLTEICDDLDESLTETDKTITAAQNMLIDAFKMYNKDINQSILGDLNIRIEKEILEVDSIFDLLHAIYNIIHEEGIEVDDILIPVKEEISAAAIETGYQDFCEMMCIDTDNYIQEVSSHYIVTDWMARQLIQKGENVQDIFNMDIWGRVGGGQMISMDSVMIELAIENNILEGQER